MLIHLHFTLTRNHFELWSNGPNRQWIDRESANEKKNGEFGINGILIKSGNNLLVKIKFRHWWYRLQPENHSYISLMMNLKKKNKTETENETATDSAFLQITNHKSHLSYIRNEHILICTHFNKSSFLQQTTVKYIFISIQFMNL